MNVLKIFLFGFSLYYIITIADMIIQLLSSHVSILITKCNVRIAELAGDENQQDDPYRIGFQYEPIEDIYYDEDDYYEDKNKL